VYPEYTQEPSDLASGRPNILDMLILDLLTMTESLFLRRLLCMVQLNNFFLLETLELMLLCSLWLFKAFFYGFKDIKNPVVCVGKYKDLLQEWWQASLDGTHKNTDSITHHLVLTSDIANC
nr:hypothetical protein [Tanacetum cinerariifolium]